MAGGFTDYATRFVKLIEAGSARQHDLIIAPSSVPPAGRTEERGVRLSVYAIAEVDSASLPA